MDIINPHLVTQSIENEVMFQIDIGNLTCTLNAKCGITATISNKLSRVFDNRNITSAGYDKLSSKSINGLNILPIEGSQEFTMLGQSGSSKDVDFERECPSAIATAQGWGPNLENRLWKDGSANAPHSQFSLINLH